MQVHWYGAMAFGPNCLGSGTIISDEIGSQYRRSPVDTLIMACHYCIAVRCHFLYNRHVRGLTIPYLQGKRESCTSAAAFCNCFGDPDYNVHWRVQRDTLDMTHYVPGRA